MRVKTYDMTHLLITNNQIFKKIMETQGKNGQ